MVYGQKSLEDMAQRSVNAVNRFLDTLMEVAGITREQAETVMAVYKKGKLLDTRDMHIMGIIKVRHGACWDKEIILRALANADEYLKPATRAKKKKTA
jgi:hypothetical protein